MSYKVKKENQKKAQKRIFVEHVIRLIKIFKVARERFRLKESNYEKVILTICGLVSHDMLKGHRLCFWK